ncbi:MAG: PEGA domain-containing protein [Candidatus Azambacteria bacterium]|nr:PEGA domain-containing protein [Candidatus Azambacteria bacterium]
MTRRFRRGIFLIFVVFFIITSVATVFFAQGYILDFNSLKFVKTGGIFIKTSTDSVKIYLDDKYIETTGGILTHSALVSGLAPKTYSIFVYKENYYPWNKTVEVKSGMVVGLNNITLFPLELKKLKVVELSLQTISEFSVVNDTVEIKNNKTKIVNAYNLADGKLLSSKKFIIATSTTEFISPDKDKKIYISDNQLWIVYLNDAKEEPFKKAGEKELLADYETPIDFFGWLNDSEHIIWFADSELNIAELDNRGGKRNSIKFYLNISAPVFWDRGNSTFYFFDKTSQKAVLYKIDLKTQ